MRVRTIAFALLLACLSGSALGQTESSTTEVPLKQQGGVYVVPALINNAITLKFIVDSGSSDVSVPVDVVLTLLRTGTIAKSDFIGEQTYTLANGSTVPSMKFRLRSLEVGDMTLNNVIANISPLQGSLLLGQSFLSRFQSWSINNTTHELSLSDGLSSQAAVTSGTLEPRPVLLPHSPSAAVQASTTQSVQNQLISSSRQFIDTLYRNMSSPNDKAIASLGEIYADHVNYFGTDMTRDKVIEREMTFLLRWPVRRYKPKNGQVFVNCDPTTLTCFARGVLEFDALSKERNQRSMGEATFQYRLRFSSPYDNLPKVVLEDGHDIKRTLQNLSPMGTIAGQ